VADPGSKSKRKSKSLMDPVDLNIDTVTPLTRKKENDSENKSKDDSNNMLAYTGGWGEILNDVFASENQSAEFKKVKAQMSGEDIELLDTQLERRELSQVGGTTKEYPTDAEDVTGIGTVLSFVGVGESYGGSLNAANRGTLNKKIIGSTKNAKRKGKLISELTVGEIKELQKITDPNNPERLFAVGMSGMIPKVFIEAQEATGVSDSDVFNRKTQEKMSKYLIQGKANTRKTLQWLQGSEDVSIDDAILGLAKEFASVPVPYDVKKGSRTIKAGQSYYAGLGGNKARHSLDKVKSVLRGARDSMKSEES
jgi:hypothetical protein